MKTFSQFISEVTLRKGEHYGHPEYQKRLDDERKKKKSEKKLKIISDTEKARRDREEGVMRGSEDGVPGHFKFNTVTKRFDIFVPD